MNRNLPVVVWAFLIFLASSFPSAKVSENSTIDFLAHKVVHLFEYGVLYLLYYRTLVRPFWDSVPGKIFQAILFVVVYGAFDEYHQSFIPGRNGRPEDVLVDAGGALSALVVWWFLRQKKLRKPIV